MALYAGAELAAILRSPDDGIHLSVCFADPQELATWLWFCGNICDSQWIIDKTYPAMEQSDLVDALFLAREQGEDSYVLRTPEEADAVMQAVVKDAFLHNMEVGRDGLRVGSLYDGSGSLARLILRERFSHVWNSAPALERVQQQFTERKRQEREFRRKAVQFRRDSSAPYDKSQVTYRGSESIYCASHIAEWEVLDEKPRLEFEAAVTALRFTVLGDLVCKKTREYVSRYYISENRMCYAILMANRFGYAGSEFVSHFENDAHLTTSTSWLATSCPEVDMFAQNHPEMEPRQLYNQHFWAINRFLTHKQTVPILLEDSLNGVAALFDLVLARVASVAEDSLFETDGVDDV